MAIKIWTADQSKNQSTVPYYPSPPYPLRVAKCHGYGGYIRVKKFEGWGKKFGRIFTFAKSSIVLGKFEQLI